MKKEFKKFVENLLKEGQLSNHELNKPVDATHLKNRETLYKFIIDLGKKGKININYDEDHPNLTRDAIFDVIDEFLEFLKNGAKLVLKDLTKGLKRHDVLTDWK